jgi:tetratricopeptide (TPR) repeat protein
VLSEVLNGQTAKPQSSAEPTFKTQARAVIVDVVVTDRDGRPVQGLPRDSFRVEEDGHPQKISSFEEHAATAHSAPTKLPKLPPNVFINIPREKLPDSVTVLLFDILNGDPAAIPLYKRAIELDPNFASAYTSLSTAYSNLTQYELAAESGRKAYELRGRASERERYGIEENYYFSVTGELEKTNQVLQWTRDYPRDLRPLAGLALNYNLVGKYEKAVAEIQAMLRLNPDSSSGYLNLEANYAALNRAEDAAAAYRESVARKLDHPLLHVNRYGVAFLQQDTAEMQRQLDWVLGKPGVEDMLLSMHSDTQAYFGHLRQAREFSRRAADSAIRSDKKESAAEWLLNAALREAELGYPAQARAQVKAAIDLASSKDVRTLAALVLARAGENAKATSLADELSNASPVIRKLKSVARCILIYVRGEAFLKAGQASEAILEFQKMIEHRGVTQNFVLGALAHLQLARACELSGNRTRARSSYEDFLKLWKDDDPDIPILKEARAEYAKLQ